MPITYHIDDTRRRVTAEASGAMGRRDLRAYKREAWSPPAVAGFDELFDLSRVDSLVDPDLSGLKELAHLAAAMDPAGRPARFAIVAPDDTHFGLARLYQLFRGQAPRANRELSVFHTREEAEAWLDAPRA